MSNDILNKIKLNKDVPIPLYYQLEQNLLALIEEGVFVEGDLIPTEKELSNFLEISRPTVRQALNSLVDSGYLIRNRGVGTFVTKPKLTDQFFVKLESYNDELIKQDRVPHTEVLRFKEIPAIDHVNKKLNLDLHKSLLHLQRLRYADDCPIVYLDTYMPYDTFQLLLQENLAENSLYSLMNEVCGIVVTHAQRYIEAVPARANEAKLLKIEENAPICLTRSVSFTDNKIPIEYSIARYRGDKTKFLVEIYKT